MRLRIFLGVTAVAMAAAAPTALAGPTTPLGHDGRWVTDADGRVVILHGVNMVYKRPPYAPDEVGFDADDAQFLVDNGFNTVRLGVIYKGVEPDPKQYDAAYISRLQATEQLLADHGIFTLVDFHQDLYNERFQGEGFPDWAVLDDGLPAEPKVGFPGNYIVMLALNRAFDHFWANDVARGRPLQNAYAQAWRQVAAGFADAPYVMGYDVFNEPWPGTTWETCANPIGCPLFDTGPLTSMSRKVHAAIRRVDGTHTVWLEPNVIFNSGADSSLPRIGPNTGFSFHDYCLPHGFYSPFIKPDPTLGADCAPFDRIVFDNADKQAKQTGQALMLSEFGATDDPTVLNRGVKLSDEHMVSWQYWHYCECDDPTTVGTGVQGLIGRADEPPTGSNVDTAKLAILSRPYPQVVAGTPVSYHFDPDHESRVFRLTYSTRTPAGDVLPVGSTTEVFVPELHYPHGYRVKVTGATVVSAPNAELLELQREAGADQVRLVLWPAGGAG